MEQVFKIQMGVFKILNRVFKILMTPIRKLLGYYNSLLI